MSRSTTDAELLASRDPEAFGQFYRQHLPEVLAWLRGHTRDRELTADLAGEVFARALAARASYDPERGPAAAWLQAMTRNLLVDSIRKGSVADEARRAAGIRELTITDDDLERVDELADQACGRTPGLTALEDLGPLERAAIRARVLDEEPYAAIAERLRCSPLVVRKRVSRGLGSMRSTLKGSG